MDMEQNETPHTYSTNDTAQEKESEKDINYKTPAAVGAEGGGSEPELEQLEPTPINLEEEEEEEEEDATRTTGTTEAVNVNVNLDSNFQATETASATTTTKHPEQQVEVEVEMTPVEDTVTVIHISEPESCPNKETATAAVKHVEPEKESGKEPAPVQGIAASASKDHHRHRQGTTTLAMDTDDPITIENNDKDHDADDDDDIVVTGTTETDTHKIHEQALAKSCSVLKDINTMLQDNPLFCSQGRAKEWEQEIQEILRKAAPKTIIGVLGNTGVGKSSLLNALLDEAAVLPTSGSRGCTAAVVELRFNSDLKKTKTQQQKKATTETETIPVYKGEICFLTLAEWGHELRILIDECSTHEEKTIYARPPDDQRQPDAAAAWGKFKKSNRQRDPKRPRANLAVSSMYQLIDQSISNHSLTPTFARSNLNIKKRQSKFRVRTWYAGALSRSAKGSGLQNPL
jgi:hypothetical protein